MISPVSLLFVIAGYFLLLIAISFFTGRRTDNFSFFLGSRRSPWYLVAFGMIGASLSGVTFISVPGEVGSSSFSYLQIVMGYLLGYAVIANILLPVYYRMNLTSIYVYLKERYGLVSYRTGALFFILSRLIGSALRLYLVAMVLHRFVFSAWNIPFYIVVGITIVFILLYSYRAGIKTIVWTDTLQTLFMLTAVVFSIVFIAREMGLNMGRLLSTLVQSHYSDIFVWDWRAGNNFFKHFFSGAFITIVMTGLDQDMMQKNLSCRSLPEAKKNMYWMSSMLVPVNLLFLALGAMLYLYAGQAGLMVENFNPGVPAGCKLLLLDSQLGNFVCRPTDELFPYLSLTQLQPWAAIAFILGLIAAAYSSADSALTALTTSFCVDFLGFDANRGKKSTRYIVHLGFSLLLFAVILIFKALNNDSLINSVFRIAGYTYGPLLGLFAFGLFTRKQVMESGVPFIALAAPIISFILSKNASQWFGGYQFGFELLILNGALTFAGLFMLSLASKRKKDSNFG